MQGSGEMKGTKKLSLLQLVFLGMAWTMPLIVFANYGIASEAAHGYLPTAYAIALLAMSFTAYSYGRMAKQLPNAGSAYGYAAKTFRPEAGFMVGWALLLDYLFNPIVCCILFSLYLDAIFPAVPFFLWVAVFVALVCAINYFGIQLSAAVSKYSVLIQLGIIGIFCVSSVYHIVSGVNAAGTGGFTMQPFLGDGLTLPSLLAGASLLCFSFLGFDTVSIMSEEADKPKRNIPRAMLIIIVVCGIVDVTVTYLGQLVLPGYNYEDPDTASLALALLVGGGLLKAIFVGSMIGAMFTGAVSSVASVSRLLYIMGRDGVLPRRIFGYLHPKHQTPVRNVALVGAICLLAAVLPLGAAISFVNFGALLAFGCVNLCVIKYEFVNLRRRGWRAWVMSGILPGAGFVAIGWLFSNLSSRAVYLGLGWLVVGLGIMLLQKYRKASRVSAESGRAIPGEGAARQVGA
ncbi:APC family permease [Paenibacillus sp. MMS18-CY102]|uniref:APC family permease n=1 Tax=Paenibacillus sp. MMS18-CY102 TaxID=2682849 RepID=UPI0013657255|nr:APC family permease [Paenibacillus sp. MMS18-CY102]MWC27282.1 amino acid permease [Paenibacillus sp. MMS18-CY102]